ncbi:unnamed protein product [Brachionus calyciflorus]|uniref:Methyltransferase FkbM domain-containing protein n=1 Tax=Brachionus calyciflorus TaxID=104777 RepID=A0A813ZSW1_9BILA|nr:unnamed protein product [Brachionus calyciflorus]
MINQRFLILFLVVSFVIILAFFNINSSSSYETTEKPLQNKDIFLSEEKECLTVKKLSIIDEWSEIFNASEPQQKIKPDVLLQTLKFMIQEVDEHDPKLIEFVKSLIDQPSNKPFNLHEPNRKDFSQFGEAIYVDQMLNGQRNGFVVEAGALDGERFSNSLFFERERGWSGILIEPLPYSYESILNKNRKMHSINACIAKKTPIVAKFRAYKEGAYSGRNSAIGNSGVGKYDYIYVPCFSLSTILKAINIDKVDFFSLDLEGGEWDVLNSLDLKKINFKLFLIEHGGDMERKEKMTNYMIQHNYALNKTDKVNIYLIKKE